MRLFDEEFFEAIDKILDSCDDKDRLWKGILDDVHIAVAHGH